MHNDIPLELKEAASGLFTDDELMEILSTPSAPPARVVEKPSLRELGEALQAQRDSEIRAEFLASISTQVETPTDPRFWEICDQPAQTEASASRMRERYQRDLSGSRATYAARTRADSGRIWDLLPPGTPPVSGDEVADEGVWRPRRTIADCQTEYDRAVFARREAQRLNDAQPSDEALERLNDAWQRQADALRSSDEPVSNHERIDQWRAGEGREKRNASRRSVRETPNTDLSTLNDDEKEAYKREKARLRKQKSRALKSAGTMA